MWTMFFSSHHCFIVIFQFLDIILHLKNKQKQKHEKWTQPETTPPIVDLIHQFKKKLHKSPFF